MSVFYALRNRLARTVMTVAGIAIGILALTVVGALAERIQTIVLHSTSFSTRTILAFAPHGALYADLTPELKRAMSRIQADPDVASVYREIILPYSIGPTNHDTFGPPSLIIGLPPKALTDATRVLRYAQGHELDSAALRSAVIGGSFAQAHGLRVGDVLSLYGNSFTIVGVAEVSFTIWDQAVVVPFTDARALLGQVISPESVSQPRDPVSALYVVAKPGSSTAILSRRIDLTTGFSARDPAELAAGLTSTVHIFDSIIFGSAAVALLVAAFSIVNTMTIAVSERTREIGIRKAIGARDRDILQDFVAEAAVIGALGGIVGIACGYCVVLAIDARSIASGNLALFELTPRLALGALVFSICISVAAGLIPALRAARLDPVQALRKVS